VTRAPGPFTLHDFVPAHLPELTDLWLASWKAAMPAIDFEERRGWFVDHLIELQRAGVQVVCAFDTTGTMAGFVTIDRTSGHLDQLAVAPAHWGGAAAELLLGEAKRRAPGAIELEVNQDNSRAVRFYEKSGFARVAAGVNPRSNLKIWRYRWRR
jgi:putative acetyltransferase